MPPSENNFEDLFYGTEIRKRHSENFLVGFDRLIALAKGCDTDNIILDSILFSAHGMISHRMRELPPEIKFDILEGTDSASYLERIVSAQSESA